MRRLPPQLTEWRVIAGAVLAVLVIAAIVVTVSSGGNNNSTTTTRSPVAAAAHPSSTASGSGSTTHAARHAKVKHAQAAHRAKKTSTKKASTKKASRTTHASSTKHTSTTHTSTSTTPTTTTTSPPPPKPKPKPAAPKPAPLPGPVVTASSGSMHAWLHAQNHAPVIGKSWDYKVLATGANGEGLSGTTLTEFAFNGTVVGRETPAVHRLKNGLMDDPTILFPARSAGVPLTMRIVVRTSAGTVTLNWPIKPRH